MEELFKRISAEEFAKLDFRKVTLVDLREPDEVLVSRIDGAINIPFSGFASKLDTIPKDKPVYVYCRVGDWSEEIADILADRGYDVTNLEGGFQAYKALSDSKIEGEKSKKPELIFIDAKNLMCPGPIVKVADALREKPVGTVAKVEATEDAFYSDIKVWCERTGNILNTIEITDGIIKANITKAMPKKHTSGTSERNDKTFVVFSGDLDKTIAAFIMANGAAAMGRNVTMFFTFWG